MFPRLRSIAALAPAPSISAEAVMSLDLLSVGVRVHQAKR
jgi:hypothetical protein